MGQRGREGRRTRGRRDGTTVPYLLGTISSSAVSFIPIVGWIAGAILDLRDAIANTVKTDWGAAGMSLREDREVLLVATPSWDTGRLEQWVTRYLQDNIDS